MGIPVLIMGESGAGKSASLRNFTPEEIGLFNVAGKPLPFRNSIKATATEDPAVIIKRLLWPEKDRPFPRAFVIDDSQYLMAFELFRRSQEAGYQKFTDIAVNFHNIIQAAIKAPAERIVYFLHHTDTTAEGRIKAKTIGKMLDDKLTLEGLFSIVLLAKTDGVRHWFATRPDGFSTAKSPMGMFAPEIDNDLKAVDAAIRDYYGLAPLAPAPETPQAPPAPSPDKEAPQEGARDGRAA